MTTVVFRTEATVRAGDRIDLYLKSERNVDNMDRR